MFHLCKGAFPWGARAGVGLEGGQRLQLVPPFPWPSDEVEVNLTNGALSDLELKFSIKCNDFICMVPNNFCSILWEITQYGHMAQAWRTPARIPLCPACCSRKQGRQARGASWRGGTLCLAHDKVGQVPHTPHARAHGNAL
jgi:hypothetical protein